MSDPRSLQEAIALLPALHAPFLSRAYLDGADPLVVRMACLDEVNRLARLLDLCTNLDGSGVEPEALAWLFAYFRDALRTLHGVLHGTHHLEGVRR